MPQPCSAEKAFTDSITEQMKSTQAKQEAKKQGELSFEAHPCTMVMTVLCLLKLQKLLGELFYSRIEACLDHRCTLVLHTEVT